jgi:hypothetical protein
MVQKANPALTPGTLAPGITVEILREPGYSKRVRPGRLASAAMKVKAFRRYGIHLTEFRHYTGDHLIPIECGGAPADPLNYWPQPKAEALLKDRLENALRRQVISGTVTIERAAEMMRDAWVAA